MSFNTHNVYIIPDMYGIGGPGSEDYIKAANTLMKKKMLFGTSYPIISIKDTAAYYENCEIAEENKAGFFYDNAAEILDLK